MKNIIAFISIGLCACVSAQEDKSKNVSTAPAYIESKSVSTGPVYIEAKSFNYLTFVLPANRSG
jgi:hypothetical protein